MDPDNSLSYSRCTKDKVKYNSVGLTPNGALCLSRQIWEAKAKRKQAKVARRR